MKRFALLILLTVSAQSAFAATAVFNTNFRRIKIGFVMQPSTYNLIVNNPLLTTEQQTRLQSLLSQRPVSSI